MYYSVYRETAHKLESVECTLNALINEKVINNLNTPAVFLNEPFISLKLEMLFRKPLENNYNVITIEWISPQETYYVMDKIVAVEKEANSIFVNPHLKIDPSTMKKGLWNIRVLVNNQLVDTISFKLDSITYTNSKIRTFKGD